MISIFHITKVKDIFITIVYFQAVKLNYSLYFNNFHGILCQIDIFSITAWLMQKILKWSNGVH